MNCARTLRAAMPAKRVRATIQPKSSVSVRQKMFIPNKRDMLFWIFYILKYGFDNYNLIGSGEFVQEKQTKLEYIDKIRENKQFLKQKKIGKLNTCEDDLLNNETISLKTFRVLCEIEHIPFCFINQNIIYCDNFEQADDPLIDDDYTGINVVHLTNQSYYALEIDGHTMLKNYRSARYLVHDLEKPIMAIGKYKVDEVKTMIKYFDLPTTTDDGKPMTKVQLYNSILVKLNL